MAADFAEQLTNRKYPIVDVRSGHYRWLVEQDWNVVRVYRAATMDPDPEIAAWGRAHDMSDGAYR